MADQLLNIRHHAGIFNPERRNGRRRIEYLEAVLEVALDQVEETRLEVAKIVAAGKATALPEQPR